LAGPFGADITQGTGVAVITNGHSRFVLTPAQTITAVDGARVFIVTIHHFANTDPVFTVVCDGTGIPVQAFSLG
jgi:hypothetical protein